MPYSRRVSGARWRLADLRRDHRKAAPGFPKSCRPHMLGAEPGGGTGQASHVRRRALRSAIQSANRGSSWLTRLYPAASSCRCQHHTTRASPCTSPRPVSGSAVSESEGRQPQPAGRPSQRPTLQARARGGGEDPRTGRQAGEGSITTITTITTTTTTTTTTTPTTCARGRGEDPGQADPPAFRCPSPSMTV